MISAFIFVLFSAAVWYLLRPIKKPTHNFQQTVETDASTATQAPPVPRYPVMTLDMIVPNGQAITSAQAVKVYKLFMQQVGYFRDWEDFEKVVLAESSADFAIAMKEYGAYLADELASERRWNKEQTQNSKKEISALKGKRTRSKTEVQLFEIDEEIGYWETYFDENMDDILAAEAAIKAFREDKRQFVVDYINKETQRDRSAPDATGR